MTATQTPPNPMAVVRRQVSEILLNEEAKKYIVPLLPHGVSLERVVSTIHQVVAENPEILECTPTSIVLAVGKGVKDDLEFGETAHLVPFNVNIAKKGQPARYEKRAKMLRDWKGDIQLVKASGAARDLDAQCFYEKEHFVYRQGTSPYIEHHPIVIETARGAMLGAYAWALISQRQPMKVVVMSVAEIDKIRQEKSKSWKDGPLPDWYARKTLIHQISKSLPKNRKLAPVLQKFEEEEIPEVEFEVMPPAEPLASAATTEQPASPTAVTPAPGDPATPEQLTRLRTLIEYPEINEQTFDKVSGRLKKGLNYGLAVTWIEALEMSIAAAKNADESDELPLAEQSA